jgi:predicted metal-dependent hydrolase
MMKWGGHPPPRAAATFKAEVQRWAARMRVRPKRVQIQRMTTKWASCSSAGRLCFSGDLLREDATFRQVVIVHELLHLLVPNHGKLFKSLMTAYVPGWEQVSRARASRTCGRGASPLEA